MINNSNTEYCVCLYFPYATNMNDSILTVLRILGGRSAGIP